MTITDQGAFHHTAFVVNDIEKVAEELAKSLSITWHLWTVEPETATVRGQEQDIPFTFRVAFGQVGDGSYELIEPHTGESLYDEHLKVKGEGYHHTCIAYPSLEALHEARDELLKQGREMIQSAITGKTEFYYFEIAEIGSILEVLYLEYPLPPPEKTIG